MTPDIQTWVSIGTALAAVLGVAWGFIEKLKTGRAERAAEKAAQEKQTAADAHKIIEVKDELIAVAQESKAAWKAKYEQEHAEYTEYRTEAHKRLNEASALVLRHSAENAELRAKTDLSPVLKHQEEQSQVTTKIIETLAKINTTQDLLIESILNGVNGRKLRETLIVKTKPAKKP